VLTDSGAVSSLLPRWPLGLPGWEKSLTRLKASNGRQ
jgi:hypothetical protein